MSLHDIIFKGATGKQITDLIMFFSVQHEIVRIGYNHFLYLL